MPKTRNMNMYVCFFFFLPLKAIRTINHVKEKAF